MEVSLVKQRGKIRGLVTRLLHKIEMEEYLVKPCLDEDEIIEVTSFINSLTAKLKILQDFDVQIEEEGEAAMDECLAYEANIYSALAALEKAIGKTVSHTGVATGFTPNSSAASHVKLPKLKLPNFAGDRLQWSSFWDVFNSTIHDNTILQPVQKFTYLKTCLSGEALACIKGLSITSVNYETAIDVLKTRFGIPAENKTEHMKSMFNITSPNTTVTQLRTFYDEVNSHMLSLSNLTVYPSSYEMSLVPLLLSKLPEQVRMNMISKSVLMSSDIDTLSLFLKYLNDEIVVRQKCNSKFMQERSQPQRETITVSGMATNIGKPVGNTASSSGNDRNNRNDDLRCAFCEGPHRPKFCKQVSSVENREKFIRDHHLCFVCLKKNHTSRQCKFRKPCLSCNRFHHISLCRQNLASGQDTRPDNSCVSHVEPADNENPPENLQISLTTQDSSLTVLPTAKAVLVTPSGTNVLVRLLFDTACNKTFVLSELIDRLELQTTASKDIKVTTFSTKEVTFESRLVTLHLRRLGGNQVFPVVAQTSPTICAPQSSTIVSHYDHLRDLQLADPYDPRDHQTPVSILVGADHYYDFIGDDIIRGKCGPVATSSKFGWVLTGKLNCIPETSTSDASNPYTPLSLQCMVSENPSQPISFESECRQMWSLESVGVTQNEANLCSDPFLKSINFSDGRYEVGLPWKDETIKSLLPSNFPLASTRLRSNLKNLKKQPSLLKEYHSILSNQHAAGIIEKVRVPDGESSNHFLPHRAVLRPEKETTKVRIVFDASARMSKSSYSLNDCVEVGPSTVPLIPSLLMNFRHHSIALLADIEKAFLQIGICESDRKYLRFLWLDDPFSPSPQIEIWQFARLIFGLKSSPAILQETIRHHLARYSDGHFSNVANTLLKDFYVDNLVTGCDTIEEAKHTYHASKTIFREAGMNLRCWESNNASIRQYVQISEDKASEQKPLSTSYLVKVLGIQWNPHSDEFIFDLHDAYLRAENMDPSKRSVLKLSASIFDPLGMLSPIIMAFKILFQTLCIQKKGWDDVLSDETKAAWKENYSSFCHFRVTIPRHVYMYKFQDVVKLQLHGFSDASLRGYGAVIYLLVTFADGFVSVHFLTSRTRVAPIRSQQTIPRLELLGALILSRLMSYTQKCFVDIEKFDSSSSICWTDSMTVIHWIRQHKIWPPFIRNRVFEIRTLLPSDCWRFCPGANNPADICSRGAKASVLQRSSLWWNGPDWLSMTSDLWPQLKMDEEETPELHQETNSCLTCCKNFEASLSTIIPTSRFSSFEKLLHVTALVLKFIRLLKKQPNACSNPLIAAEDVQEAQQMWILHLQDVAFQPELRHLRHGGAMVARNKNLNLFLDENGIIRCRGRISAATLPSSNNPILIPNDPDFEKLIIRDAHEKTFHGGVPGTLAKVREQFWVLRGRQRVKQCLRRCVTCRKIQGLPFVLPPPAELFPSITFSRAFSTVGLDYCGPFYFVFRKGEECRKAYIALFTCITTRAIHLEVVTDLKTTSFINALKRFISRRGIPNIVSDNAKTFKLADKILSSSDVQRFASDKRIVWHFITEYAPWEGGFYERLMKDLKSALKKTIKKVCLSLEEFTTIVCEIEGVMNSRPLVYVGENVEEVLTPSHFLILQRMTKEGAGSEKLVKPEVTCINYARKLLEKFWSAWHSDYILSLRERSFAGVHKRRGVPGSPSVGDVVLLSSSGSRLKWQLAIVEAVKRGRDSLVRSALIRLPSGKVLRRPINCLVPLEISQPS